KAAVVDPLEAVARDLPPRLAHRGDDIGIALDRRRDREHGDGQPPLGEDPPQPPESGARTVLEHRLDIHVAPARPRLRPEHVGQECFRRGIAVEDAVLAALLVVDDELYGDARSARPARIGRHPAIADEVAGITRTGW